MKERMKLFKFSMLLAFVFLLQPLVGYSQTYQVNTTSSSIKVKGTSTLHDWEMVVGEFDCKVDAFINDQLKLVINSINFSCDATSLTSDNSIMDKKAQEALNANRHKRIGFVFASIKEVAIQGGTVQGNVNGNMNIAGVNRKLVLPFSGVIDTDYNVKLSGELKLKMSDFNMKSPTALLGTVKTGDDVTVHYELHFDKMK